MRRLNRFRVHYSRCLVAAAACSLLAQQPARVPPAASGSGRDADLHSRYAAGGAARQRARQERKLLTNFRKSAFKVYENGVEQPIKIFRREDVPVSMGIIIDNSGSMRDKRAKVAAAALALVKASNPQDEVFIVNFNDEAYLDQPFTSDIKKLEQALDQHRFPGRHGHARRHQHVDRLSEGEGQEGQESAAGGHRRQRQHQQSSRWST